MVHFVSTTLTTVKAFEDGTHGLPKHVGGDFVHLLCIYFRACKDGFISCFLHYARYTQY
jgi:hypothetical protein